MESKTLYILFVYGEAYSTHENEWDARSAWYSLGEKSRANAKILVFTEVEELEL